MQDALGSALRGLYLIRRSTSQESEPIAAVSYAKECEKLVYDGLDVSSCRA